MVAKSHPRLLVTGASGLLGINLSLQTCNTYEVTGTVNQHVIHAAPFEIIPADLTSTETIKKIIDQVKPDILINCAALAGVDDCDTNPQLAEQLNTLLPAELARLAVHHGFRLIHISTDCVFDGLQKNYTETDQPNPINTYARTKLAGELAVASTDPSAVVARVNFFGWSLVGCRSLAELFYTNLREGKTMQGFSDIFFCPLLVNDLADILIDMANSHAAGLYHVVGPECISKYEFGQRLASQFGFATSLIKPVSWKDGGLKVIRSPNLCLNIDKYNNFFGHHPPDITAGLLKFYRLLQEGYPQKLYAMAKI